MRRERKEETNIDAESLKKGTREEEAVFLSFSKSRRREKGGKEKERGEKMHQTVLLRFL